MPTDYTIALREIDNYLRNDLIHAPDDRNVFLAVVRQLLVERCAYGELRRKAIYHARRGDVFQTKRVLQKLGIAPSRIDAVMPLIRG